MSVSFLSRGQVVSGVAEGGTINKHLLVALGTGNQQVKLPGAAKANCLGVTDENDGVTVGKEVAVIVSGVALMTASAAIAKGAEVEAAGTAGKIRTATTATYVVGVALEAASADGDLVPVEIRKYYKA